MRIFIRAAIRIAAFTAGALAGLWAAGRIRSLLRPGYFLGLRVAPLSPAELRAHDENLRWLLDYAWSRDPSGAELEQLLEAIG